MIYQEQPTSSYTFTALAQDNMVVYYGAFAASQQHGTLALCEVPDVDMISSALLNKFFAGSRWLSIAFGDSCWDATSAQASTAPDFQDCSLIVPEKQARQAMGQHVLLSLGDTVTNSSFTSDTQNWLFASILWNLFCADTPGNNRSAIRRFGSVVLDSFDLDDESKKQTGYVAIATASRGLFAQDASKTYHLPVAPHCIYPDAPNPIGAMI